MDSLQSVSRESEKQLEVNPLEGAYREACQALLRQFGTTSGMVESESEDIYAHGLRESSRVAARYLKGSGAADCIRWKDSHTNAATVVFPHENQITFFDVVSGEVIGGATVIYQVGDTKSPSIHGTCTLRAHEGKGFNSMRIRRVAQYLRATKGEILHSSRHFDDERSRATWETLVKSGDAEWVEDEGRYRFKQASIV